MTSYSRNTFRIILFLGVFVTLFLFSLPAQAQDLPTLDPDSPAQNPPGGGNTGNNPGNPNAPGYNGNFGVGGNDSSDTPIVTSDNNGSGQTSANSNQTTNTQGSNPANVIDVGEDSKLLRMLWQFVVGTFGRLTWIGGQFLDFALQEFVIDFGENYKDSGIGNRVDVLWSTVRDVFNVLFIFGLLYIGFKMILDSENSTTRKWLVNLIIAALLVNFSLFITKLVVDVNNLLATEIASAFPKTNANGPNINADDIDVSTSLMNAMGVTSIWGSNGERASATYLPPALKTTTSGASFAYIFGALIVLLVSAFVFAAGAFLLMIRYIVLHFYMLMSPFLFLGFVLPQFMSMTKNHWMSFFKRAFVAPVYLLFVYFALHLLTGTDGDVTTNASGNPNFLGVFGDTGASAIDSFAATVPPFLLGCGFLIGAVIAANKLGAEGSNMVMNVGNNLKGRAQRGLRNAGYGTASFAARNTVGRGAEALSRQLDRNTARDMQGNRFNRALGRFTDRTAGAALRTASGVSVGGGLSLAQARERDQAQLRRANATVTENRRASNGEYGRMSPEQLLDLVRRNPRLLQDSAVISQFTEAQMTALRGSGMMSNDEFGNLAGRRSTAQLDNASEAFEDTSATVDQLNTALNQLAQTVRSMSTDQKVALGTTGRNSLTDERIAYHLSDNDIEQLEQSGRFSATQITNIRTARDTARTNMVSGSAPISAVGAAANDFHEQRRNQLLNNPQRAGELPVAVYLDPTMAQFISPQAIEARMRNGISDVDIRTIRNNINAYTAGAPAGASAQWTNWMSSNRVEAVRFWNV